MVYTAKFLVSDVGGCVHLGNKESLPMEKRGSEGIYSAVCVRIEGRCIWFL